MGSPLGPTLANVFLGYHKKKWLADCPAQFKPSYYRRYVDDIFVLLPDANCLDEFKQYLNQKHPNINFTSEVEVDNSLPFLDIFVIYIYITYIISVYRKPTFSGVYTNYDSYIPLIYKSSLISTLLHRAFTICSNWNQIHKEIENIISVMVSNGYPSRLLDRIVARFLNNIHRSKPVIAKEPNESLQIILPYLGTLTKRLEKKINRSLQQHLPSIKISFIYRASTRLRTLFALRIESPPSWYQE